MDFPGTNISVVRGSSLSVCSLRRRVAPRVSSAALVLFASLLFGPFSSPAHASNTLEISGTAEATSSVGTSIVAGDTFTFTFTLDLDSAADSTTIAGNTFKVAVDAFALTAGSGNVGTWSPTGVNWQISPVSNFVTNKNGDSITLQVKAPNAPDINGVAFRDLGISLDWDSSEVDIEQVADGTSLATALGTTSPNLDAASYYFELRDTNFSSASFVVPPIQDVDPSSNTPDSGPAQSIDFEWELSGGAACSSSQQAAQLGTWTALPDSNDCTPPSSTPSADLLGWATFEGFPQEIAERQVSNGWGAYETFDEDGNLTGVFIPAGGSTFISGATRLYPIWSN